VMCGGSILSCCPRNPHGYERVLKEEKAEYFIRIAYNPFEDHVTIILNLFIA